MKKVFIVIILLFIIIAIGVFVFAVTFDANKYKDMLSEKIQEAIDKDVRIGNISLNVFPGLAFRLDGLAIKDKGESWDNIILSAGSIDASLKLMPLLKKDIEVERLKLRGLEIVIDKDSLITLSQAKGGQPANIDTGVAAAGALKFLAESISIEDSSVRYIDRRSRLPIDLKIEIIEAVIKNVSFYGPAGIEARLSAFGRGVENIGIRATIYPEMTSGKPYLKNLELTANLGKLNVMEALTAFGLADIARQYIDEEIAGDLVISSAKLDLDPKEIYDFNALLTLSDGSVTILPITETLKSIDLKVESKAGDLLIQKLTGLLSKGSFSAKGAIEDIVSGQRADIDITLKDIDVAKFLPDPVPGRPGFEGIFGLIAHSKTKGFTGEAMLSTLAADGTIDLSKAMLKDMNVLTVALDKLNMLPGLVAKLKEKLPDSYKELLKQKDTAFKPIKLDFNVQDGRFIFQKARIESDAFYLLGSGYLGLNRDIAIHSDIFIPKDLSEAFVGAVRELAYLQNSQGMITMPVDIGGKLPGISVRPDLDYVIQKLAVSKGQELLESLFKKSGSAETKQETQTQREDSGGAPPSDESGQQKEIRPEEAIIRTIFDIINSPKK